jgi:8-oxo-dGTP diphosphatase
VTPQVIEPVSHESLAVVLQVREDRLCVLLWQRAQSPARGCWALPGGLLAVGESLESSIQRHLAAKVDVAELAHLEQLETRSDPSRLHGHRLLATAYLGLIPIDAEPAVPDDTCWHPVDALPPLAFDHAELVAAGCERLRSKLSYTNIGFALAPATFTISELREIYRAALGHEISASNLSQVLLRRQEITPTGGARRPGPAGGRPAATYRFCTRTLEVTDRFAVLRPPAPATSGS